MKLHNENRIPEFYGWNREEKKVSVLKGPSDCGKKKKGLFSLLHILRYYGFSNNKIPRVLLEPQTSPKLLLVCFKVRSV